MNFLKPYFLYRPDLLLQRILHNKPSNGNGECEVNLPWGVPIHLNSKEMVGNSIWRTGVFELGVSEAVCRLCRSGDTVADVGANIGYMTSIMAWCVGAKGSVLSFEPHPQVLKTLRQNINSFGKISELGPVSLYETALSNENGTAKLITSAEFESNEGTAFLGTAQNQPNIHDSVTVSTRCLDDILESRQLRVMKVDVEGHELGVFQGGNLALKNKRIENIVYEEHGGIDSESHRFLQKLGYTVFSLGWRLNGPLIGDLRSRLHNDYETPNFVATLKPEEVESIFLPRGWQVLKVRS